MSLFIQVHSLKTPDSDDRHQLRRAPDEFGAVCLRHWVSESDGVAFCLVEADSVDLALALHAGEAGLHLEAVHPVLERL